MKKLFTLVALLALYLGAKAEIVVDAEINFATQTEVSLGWGQFVEGSTLDIQDGYLHYHSDAAGANPWDTQFTLAGLGGINVELGETYTLELKIKGSVAGNWQNIGFVGGNKYGNPQVTTDFTVVQLVYENATSDNANPLLQCGNWIGDWWIEYIKITHDQKKEARPVEWIEQITSNGDAETAWPAWALEETDGVNANWRGDRTGEICAWALTMGRNFDEGDDKTTDSSRARPFPADIDAEPGNESNHVFAVHVTQVADIEGGGDGSAAWSNQFWIQAPKGYKSGTAIKLHFRYKAEKAATVSTQIHKQWPSVYLWYVGAGDVNFTTEWQEFDKQITFDDNQGGGWSLAFNLCSGLKEENVYYFDDLSWQVMKLDEGYFVAGANPGDGLAYDLYEATEFKQEGENLYVATVGEAGKADTYVNEVMISTVRGHDGSFKGATLKPTNPVTNDADDWNDYTEASNAVIKLPGLGVWTIQIDTEYKSMSFEMSEGTPYEKITITPNPTEIVINAVERKYKSADEAATDGVELPEGYASDNADDNNPWGQPWDNQFWIVANRALKKGESTVLQFKYKAATAAKASTQDHKAPGAYLWWDSIGEVNFTEEWQDFEKTFKVPDQADGMESIAFNLAEIKDANVYEIKDVVWKTEDEFESLINMEENVNFFVKIGAGTSPYQYGTDPAGISSVVNTKSASTAIYNLAGQRVSKDYKGIVVKEGRKYITK